MERTTQPARRTAIDEARDQFEAWRKNHKQRSRIPEDLWDKAAHLARAHGVNPIARALHLDYYDLKHRTARPRVSESSRPAFIEVAVSPSPSPVSTESLVEMERPDGARMRVRVAGQNDLLALTVAFWRCQA